MYICEYCDKSVEDHHHCTCSEGNIMQNYVRISALIHAKHRDFRFSTSRKASILIIDQGTYMLLLSVALLKEIRLNETGGLCWNGLRIAVLQGEHEEHEETVELA